MTIPYLKKLKQGCEHPGLGNKARALLLLSNHGLPIPETWVCTCDAYVDGLRNPDSTKKRLRDELCASLNMQRSYAVRSSCNLEDGSTCSHAGVFKSVLNVSGADDLIGAIQSVWDSVRQECAAAYMQAMGIDQQAARMAVIIQAMVPARLSGVVFSRNPVTGADEVIIEAVRGSGARLMQDGADPARWICRKGKLVHAAGEAILSQDVLGEILLQTKRIAAFSGKAVDLEWAYNGSCLYWLQLREITNLTAVDVYTNYFSKEFLPGMIKPLVWSVNIPVVNGAWKRMLTELVGPNDIDIKRLARSFYYRAYFNTGVIGSILEKLGFARETLETIMGFNPDLSKKIAFRPTSRTFALLPRIIIFILRKMALAGSLEKFIAHAQARFRELEAEAELPDNLRPHETLARVGQLCALTTQSAYYNIAAWLNMSIYGRILKVLFRKRGIDVRDPDLYCGIEGLEQIDPLSEMRFLGRELRSLDQRLRARIENCTFDEFMNLPGIGGIQERVSSFMARFGYLSDSGNDFSAIQWREQPDLILRLLFCHSAPEEQSTSCVSASLMRLPLVYRLLARFFLGQARKYKFYKEAVSATHNYGYSLFRKYFLALAKQFAAQGYIRSAGDIFLLAFDEIGRVVEGQAAPDDILTTIELRRRELQEFKDIALPDVIYGDMQPQAELQVARTLRGIAASGGYYSGRVKVVKGIGEFGKLERGDVLVIPHSDVGLTPLFARASAVIAESGGMLCHSAIIAREYGIPAVIAVPQACALADNTLVTVDGYQGTVFVHA